MSHDPAAPEGAAVALQRVVCVLGMHRSGTSCLAGNLQAAGLEMGQVTTRSVPGNPAGTREPLYLRLLNDALLAVHGAAWDHPGDLAAYQQPDAWTPFQQLYRDLLLEQAVTAPRWGMKDPRMLLLLEFWQQGIEGMTLVGSLRHPLTVARSLEARNGMPIEDGLALWEIYNRRLLEIYGREPFPVCEFGVPEPAYARRLAEVAGWLGLAPGPSSSFFEASYITQHVARDDTLPAAVAALYAELKQLAELPVATYEAPRRARAAYGDHLSRCSEPARAALESYLAAQEALRRRRYEEASSALERCRRQWGEDDPLLEEAAAAIGRGGP